MPHLYCNISYSLTQQQRSIPACLQQNKKNMVPTIRHCRKHQNHVLFCILLRFFIIRFYPPQPVQFLLFFTYPQSYTQFPAGYPHAIRVSPQVCHRYAQQLSTLYTIYPQKQFNFPLFHPPANTHCAHSHSTAPDNQTLQIQHALANRYDSPRLRAHSPTSAPYHQL